MRTTLSLPYGGSPWQRPPDRDPPTEIPNRETPDRDPLVMWPVMHAGTETPRPREQNHRQV